MTRLFTVLYSRHEHHVTVFDFSTAYPSCGDILEDCFKAQRWKLKRLFCKVSVRERKVYYKTTTNRGKSWLILKYVSCHLRVKYTRFRLVVSFFLFIVSLCPFFGFNLVPGQFTLILTISFLLSRNAEAQLVWFYIMTSWGGTGPPP